MGRTFLVGRDGLFYPDLIENLGELSDWDLEKLNPVLERLGYPTLEVPMCLAGEHTPDIVWRRTREEVPVGPQLVLVCWGNSHAKVLWYTGIEGRLWAEAKDDTGHSYLEPCWWAPLNFPVE